jgi:hypothetical protein
MSEQIEGHEATVLHIQNLHNALVRAIAERDALRRELATGHEQYRQLVKEKIDEEMDCVKLEEERDEAHQKLTRAKEQFKQLRASLIGDPAAVKRQLATAAELVEAIAERDALLRELAGLKNQLVDGDANLKAECVLTDDARAQRDEALRKLAEATAALRFARGIMGTHRAHPDALKRVDNALAGIGPTQLDLLEKEHEIWRSMYAACSDRFLAVEEQLTAVVAERDAANGALDFVRGYLRQGATVSAMNPNGPILEPLPDGSFNSGLIIDNDAAHSCGDHCQRPMCVLRRKLAMCRAALESIAGADPGNEERRTTGGLALAYENHAAKILESLKP